MEQEEKDDEAGHGDGGWRKDADWRWLEISVLKYGTEQGMFTDMSWLQGN